MCGYKHILVYPTSLLNFLLSLETYFSMYGFWTSSISVNWEYFRKANSRLLTPAPKTYRVSSVCFNKLSRRCQHRLCLLNTALEC